MEQTLNNVQILAWLRYFAEHMDIDLQKVKILDMLRQGSALIPTVERHEAVLVLTGSGQADLFYRMWNAGLGSCVVWYSEGPGAAGPARTNLLSDMINRGARAPAAMLILNPAPRAAGKGGVESGRFSRGAMRAVGSETRAVILNKLHLSPRDTLCVASGASIVVDAASIVTEGEVLAIEYSASGRQTLEENVELFGLGNVTILDRIDDSTLEGCPAATRAMLVASSSLEQELQCLLRRSPGIEFVIYTLDFRLAATLPALLAQYGVADAEVIHLAVSRLSPKNTFVDEPAPWLISGHA